MADTPVVSVIIPHLNAQDALGRCLDALAVQQDVQGAFEVIVVDNGSDTRPDAICGAYDFVRLTEELTPGPGPARSHGARLAKADLLAFIDSDCIADPDWIARIIDHLREHTDTSVIGGDVRILRIDRAHPTGIEAYESVYGYRMQLYVERDNYAATCNMAVRREAFQQVGDFAGISIAEDMDWGRRATAMGLKIDYVPSVRISTPARETFRELTRKWDRHIAHDYTELERARDQIRWVLRALALAVSPLGEVARIARSPHISGPKERSLAFLCLVRIRLYRAWRMLSLLQRGNEGSLSGAWRHRG